MDFEFPPEQQAFGFRQIGGDQVRACTQCGRENRGLPISRGISVTLPALPGVLEHRP